MVCTQQNLHLLVEFQGHLNLNYRDIMNKTSKSKTYKATKAFKDVVSERMMTKDQYTAMIKGQADGLSGLTEKRMNYLLMNGLIKKV